MRKLTAIKVAKAKLGKYSDGGNLYLVVSRSGARKWVLRFTWHGKPKEMGLGSAAIVPLSEVRERATNAMRTVSQGLNPIQVRKKTYEVPEFGKMADDVVDALTPGFRNAKHIAQWRMTLEAYAKPLRERSVDTIGTDDVLAVLKPIWQQKPETASRLRGRIEKVLDAAKARGFREGENPARWRGHLDHLLPKPQKLKRGHHAAMPYRDVPALIGDLRKRPATAARALEFCILTAARTAEVLGAKWIEIDLDSNVWTIPADRTKSGREHRVPLSGPAISILKKVKKQNRGDEFVFEGQRHDKPLSSMSMTMILRRMNVVDATVHGFRSSFRDWAGNETDFPREIAELALSHSVGDKVEQAYRRGDAIARRLSLMESWATYCESKSSRPASNSRKTKSGMKKNKSS